MSERNKQLEILLDNIQGKVGVPVLMYVLGVPGFLCVLAWLFFFKGK